LTRARQWSYTEAAVRLPLTLRFGLSIGLGALVVCIPLLPPEHVHLAGIEGRTTALVHSHELDGGDVRGSGASLTRSHGDHARAIFLTTVFERTSARVLPAALHGVAAVIVPILVPVATAHTRVGHRIHGPPGPVWLTRGPPLC
jgi:hypothetical protein